MTTTDQATQQMPGASAPRDHDPDPAGDRPEPGLPGADRETPRDLQTPSPQQAPGEREDELPARLGERIGRGPGDGGAIDDPDLLPDVQIPETAM